ncbi:MAG TPA: YitT family protein [Candidatus Coprenecus pullistercoris]|nr:YitT family protein [Candidatus Coprenecus pullistercoris]
MNPTAKKVLVTSKEYLIITIGLVMYCFSWTSFLIPKGIVGGAIPGLATFVNYATGGLIPVSATYLAVNVVLLILGFLILGRGFGFKTIYCILLNSVLLQVLPDLIPWESTVEEPFLNALIGGFIGAVGIVMIFNQGGSTGGTDIIALILSKFREISPGRVYLFCDLVIVGSVLFLPGKTLSDVIYGYLQVIAFSSGVDMLLTGTKQSVQVMIFSEKFNEIADALMSQLKRGVTAFDGIGWYTKETHKVLVVIARKHQLNEINKIVKGIDRSAFMSVTSTMSVYGRGFDELKGPEKIQWKRKRNQKGQGPERPLQS